MSVTRTVTQDEAPDASAPPQEVSASTWLRPGATTAMPSMPDSPGRHRQYASETGHRS
jgi:hypothetical protein